jgi:hypothetical protein
MKIYLVIAGLLACGAVLLAVLIANMPFANRRRK